MKDSLTIHHTGNVQGETSIPDPHQDVFSKTVLGFWMYLMTDCLLFATLFATYAVLHNNTFGGPSSRDIFDIPMVFLQTIALLLSSVTCGFALLSAVNNKKNHIIPWIVATLLLGSFFIFAEAREFIHLVEEGHSWSRSAFLSSFFTLVGTHGLHVSVGLLWMVVLIAQFHWQGLTVNTFRRLAIFGLFWHFIDLIWIFVFTFVYLMGVI